MEQTDLRVAMQSIAESMTEWFDQHDALNRIVRAAVETIPGADHASITVRRTEAVVETMVASSELIYRVDQIQYELLEGPCYDAVTSDPVNYSPDLAHDRCWPRFGPRAAALGIAALQGIRLSGGHQYATALNLYSEKTEPFSDALDVVLLFASHASVALGYAEKVLTLNEAVETRTLIGKAIGIVMHRYHLTDDGAFEFLLRLSQNNNVKIRDLADKMVAMTNAESAQEN